MFCNRLQTNYLLYFLLFACVVTLTAFACNKNETADKPKPKVLIFCKTAGFHHGSIPAGIAAIQKMGAENGFGTDTSTNAALITAANLKQYAAVIFLNTTGDILNAEQQTAFEQYIKNGGGFVGVHAAADTEYEWPWYNGLVGAYFNGHPAQQEAVLHVTDNTHLSTKHLPAQWKRKDEWYNYKSIADDLHVLITIDEKTYTGGTNGDNHPMAWYHSYAGGRAFYTGLGHTDESYTEPMYLQHLLGGIKYATGLNK